MPAKLNSVARKGIDVLPVQVEVDVSNGLHSFQIVGLGDKAINEAKERISSALKNTGFKPPRSFNKRVVINLAPADIKKEGGIYDLPMAVGFLIDSGQLKPKRSLEEAVFLGELGLDGSLRPISGAILYASYAKDAGYKTIVVPKENFQESSLIKNIEVVSAETLNELVGILEERFSPARLSIKSLNKNTKNTEYDFSLIQGQAHAKQALEIAAAGGHNVLFQGPPGSGKTLLSKTVTTILPALSPNEALEVTRIESVCGGIDLKNPLINERPFRAPHHASSEVAILGGGSNLMPGEITRAHRGVLFLDEFPEFHRDILESLRQPLEEGSINIARAKGAAKYPARFMLIAAANPCPCGYHGDASRECSCALGSIIKYQKKLSGPIADRIDLHVFVPRQQHAVLTAQTKSGEDSSIIQKRVEKARSLQEKRFENDKIFLNSEMKIRHIKKYCALAPELESRLGEAVEKFKLSARGYHSTLKVARTVADIRGAESIAWDHVATALQYAKRDVGL